MAAGPGHGHGHVCRPEEPHNPHLKSYKHLVCKNPLSPTVSLTLPSLPPKQVPRHHLYMSFEYLQGW